MFTNADGITVPQCLKKIDLHPFNKWTAKHAVTKPIPAIHAAADIDVSEAETVLLAAIKADADNPLLDKSHASHWTEQSWDRWLNLFMQKKVDIESELF